MTRLINGSTNASEDSDVVDIEPWDRKDYHLVQVKISSSATVKVQGRLASDLPWVDLKTYTSSGADPVAQFPQMRFSMTGNDGTVDAEIDKLS